MLIAQRAHTREVAGRGHENSGRADNALDNDRADGAGTLKLDDLLEVLKRAFALLRLRVRPEGRAVEVGAEEVHVLGGVLVRPAARIAGRGDGSTGVAVVRAVEREHLVLVRVDAGHADRVLDGVGPAIGEEHLVHVLCDQAGDELGGLAAGSVRVLRCDGRERRSLVLDRLDDLRMLVADVHIDELRREVEELIAVVIPEVAALGGGNDHRVQGALGTPGVEDVRAVEVVDALALSWVGREIHDAPRFVFVPRCRCLLRSVERVQCSPQMGARFVGSRVDSRTGPLLVARRA